MVNYALLYGKTAFTLAKDIGVTQQAAQEFIDAYFAGFPRVRAFIDRTLEEARATGVVKTMYGRRRLVPELTSRNCQIAIGRRARGGQHADPGHGRRHPEARDDRRPRRARAAPGRADDPHGPRRAAVRSAASDAPRRSPRSCATRCRRRRRLNVPLTVDVGIGENWKDAKS